MEVGGEGDYIPIATYTVFCIKMGSDESHFNVSSHKTVSTNHNLFEEKGEPKRYRTEVLTARPNRLTHHHHHYDH